jgi:hypothetical protein
MIADNDCINFTTAADQKADLPVNGPRESAYLRGQFGSDNIFRCNAPAIKPFQLTNLQSAKPSGISGNFIDRRFSSLQDMIPIYTHVPRWRG